MSRDIFAKVMFLYFTIYLPAVYSLLSRLEVVELSQARGSEQKKMEVKYKLTRTYFTHFFA